jgi:hypothetical protein
MSQWFNDLSEHEQEIVLHGWGSEKFASWVAWFLLTTGGAALKSRLPAEQRAQLSKLLAQRSMMQRRPGHQADFVERLYQQLNDHVQSIVLSIDDHTGKHGRDAVHWLDVKASSLESSLHDLCDGMMHRR